MAIMLQRKLQTVFIIMTLAATGVNNANTRVIDDSYLREYVATANNAKLRYVDNRLELYAAIPWGNVISATLFGGLGGSCAVVSYQYYAQTNQGVALAMTVLSGLIGASGLAYLGYVAYEVNKDTPYIIFDSYGVTVSGQKVAWHNIASVEGTVVKTQIYSGHKINDIYLGSSTPVITNYMHFYDKYKTPVLTIVGDGWLPVSFDNFVSLANWYIDYYGKKV